MSRTGDWKRWPNSLDAVCWVQMHANGIYHATCGNSTNISYWLEDCWRVVLKLVLFQDINYGKLYRNTVRGKLEKSMCWTILGEEKTWLWDKKSYPRRIISVTQSNQISQLYWFSISSENEIDTSILYFDWQYALYLLCNLTLRRWQTMS